MIRELLPRLDCVGWRGQEQSGGAGAVVGGREKADTTSSLVQIRTVLSQKLYSSEARADVLLQIFLWASAVLLLGVGTSMNAIACAVGIWWCIFFYATTKVIIYSESPFHHSACRSFALSFCKLINSVVVAAFLSTSNQSRRRHNAHTKSQGNTANSFSSCTQWNDFILYI